MLRDGYGADRGFQEVDEGQYDEPAEVFTACGNGMAMRTAVGRELGWFDDDFFMYYEDTDLSWRLRSRGWSIQYVPTAVLRHVHSATSTEWSPRWVFHVERNRLLMLTKNASGPAGRRRNLGLPTQLSRVARAHCPGRSRPTSAPGISLRRTPCTHPAGLPAPCTGRVAPTPSNPQTGAAEQVGAAEMAGGWPVRVGIYDRFWHSMGGGERHAGMIGQIMSRAGHDVDLIGHSDVSLRDLSDRVALDLSRTRLRVRPDRGEDELSDITAEYDLLVNATYMSRLVSKAGDSAYLCFFPTPF